MSETALFSPPAVCGTFTVVRRTAFLFLLLSVWGLAASCSDREVANSSSALTNVAQGAPDVGAPAPIDLWTDRNPGPDPEPEVTFLPRWPVRLQQFVTREYQTFFGELALYVHDLETGVRFTHNASTPMYLASGVKIPFMIELLRQVDRGKISLDEELEYTEDDVRDGAPVFSRVEFGTLHTLESLMEAMIQHSDNAASDMVAKRVGIERINKRMKKLGYDKFGPMTSLLEVRRLAYRGVDERVATLTPTQIFEIRSAKGKARLLKFAEIFGEAPDTYRLRDIARAYRGYYAQGYNSGAMRDFGRLLEDIARREVVNEKVSQTMIDVMLGTVTGSKRARKYLPATVPIAHKTGTQYRRVCDLAIIYVAKNRPVVFSACAKTGRSKARAEEVIARTARRTFELLAPESVREELVEIETLTSSEAETLVEKRRWKRRRRRAPKYARPRDAGTTQDDTPRQESGL